MCFFISIFCFFQMFFLWIPLQVLEIIVGYLDASSALSFIQVNRYVNKIFEKNTKFWMTVVRDIGIEARGGDSVEAIKKSLADWKTGEWEHVYSSYRLLF